MKLLGLFVVMALPVAAQAGNKLKAHLKCTEWLVDKKDAGDDIKSGKRAKLTTPIRCEMDTDEDTGNMPFDVDVHTVRTVDKKKVESKPLTGSTGEGFSGMLQLGTDYTACDPFDIVGTLSLDKKVMFTATLKVQTSCPKPKPIAATVKCSQDDNSEKLTLKPGSKRVERLAAAMSCELTSKDPRYVAAVEDQIGGKPTFKVFADATWKNTGMGPDNAGTNGAQHADGAPNGNGYKKHELSFDGDQWDRCADIDFVFQIVDAEGNVLAKQTIKTKHTCGE